MKKLYFTLHLVLIFSTTFIMPTQSPTLLKSMISKLEAFKQYFVQKKENIPPSINIFSQPLLQTPTRTPIIFYYPSNEQIELDFIVNNKLEKTLLSPPQIHRYNISPQKKYLILQLTEAGIVNPKTSWLEKIKTQTIETIKTNLLENASGYKIVKNIHTANTTKIVDLQTQTVIGSFDGDLITYEFSPHETTLLIARRHLGKKINNKGSVPLGARPPNDTTRYELFDIDSKTIIQTFENIKTINYTTENSLITEYDNGQVEQIILQKNESLSLMQKVMSLFGPQSSTQVITKKVNIQNISKKITYHDATKNLYINLPNQEEITVNNVLSYILSPIKNYLVIMTASATINLINMKTGNKIDNVCTNTITYEFSPNKEEDCLITLGSLSGFLTGKDILYSLIKLEETKSTTLTTFTTDNAYYFKSPDELIVINKKGSSLSYDPSTGETFAAIEQKKQDLINKKNLEKEEAEKIKREQDEQIKKIEQEVQEEAKKQATFVALSPKEQVALPREELPKTEIKKREEFTSPINAVRERGLSSLKQLASQTVSDVKEYFSPLKIDESVIEKTTTDVVQSLKKQEKKEELIDTVSDVKKPIEPTEPTEQEQDNPAKKPAQEELKKEEPENISEKTNDEDELEKLEQKAAQEAYAEEMRLKQLAEQPETKKNWWWEQ